MSHSALIISTSLNNASHSRVMANTVREQLEQQDVNVTYLDIRDFHLPHAATDNLESFPDIQTLRHAVKEHQQLFISAGIYNYTVASSAKNCLEVIDNTLLEDKITGLMFAAGGNNAYMAGLSFINALMLDFRCWVSPRFVYATANDFREQKIVSPKINQRIKYLATHVMSR